MTIMSIAIEIYIKLAVFGRFYDIENFLYIAAIYSYSVDYKENDIMILKLIFQSYVANLEYTYRRTPGFAIS